MQSAANFCVSFVRPLSPRVLSSISSSSLAGQGEEGRKREVCWTLLFGVLKGRSVRIMLAWGACETVMCNTGKPRVICAVYLLSGGAAGLGYAHLRLLNDVMAFL